MCKKYHTISFRVRRVEVDYRFRSSRLADDARGLCKPCIKLCLHYQLIGDRLSELRYERLKLVVDRYGVIPWNPYIEVMTSVMHCLGCLSASMEACPRGVSGT